MVSEDSLSSATVQQIFKAFMKKSSFGNSREIDLKETDQGKGLPPPLLELGYDETKEVIELPSPKEIKVDSIDLREAIERRRSIRTYADDPLTIEELSWLLWCTQGVKQVVGNINTLRTVPSGGARHPFETYLLVNRVKSLHPGLYRFLAIEHRLAELSLEEGLADKVTKACWQQQMVKNSAVTFFWVFVPYRSVWRYGDKGYRTFGEVGFICQNLYLGAEAIRSGVCAIGAYNLDEMHRILGINGDEQFLICCATVGKKK
jgi:SagB-type dehydrogenase family enzyme